MSLLKQQDIDELKAIYRRKYGKDLTDEAAWEMGNRLLRVFAVLTRLPLKSPENGEVRTPSHLTDSARGS